MLKLSPDTNNCAFQLNWILVNDWQNGLNNFPNTIKVFSELFQKWTNNRQVCLQLNLNSAQYCANIIRWKCVCSNFNGWTASIYSFNILCWVLSVNVLYLCPQGSRITKMLEILFRLAITKKNNYLTSTWLFFSSTWIRRRLLLASLIACLVFRILYDFQQPIVIVFK